MRKPIYFISDVHLQLWYSEKEEHKKSLLVEFLKEVKDSGGTLFIAGDLFDFWFEYKYVIPRHFFKILRYLQEIHDHGCEIHIVVGNHDYWLYDFIRKEIGAKVHYKPVEVLFKGKKFYIAHGDGILKKDYGYKFLRFVIRNKIMIKLFTLLGPTIAFRLAKRVSQSSRKRSIRNDAYFKQAKSDMISFAKEKFKKGFDFVILGHYHLPTKFSENNQVFMNIGDWVENFSYGYYDGDKISLKYWVKEKSV